MCKVYFIMFVVFVCTSVRVCLCQKLVVLIKYLFFFIIVLLQLIIRLREHAA